MFDPALQRSPVMTRRFFTLTPLRPAFWSLVDQGVISIGTFLLNLSLARQLDASEYGIFALLLGAYFLAQHFNASLIYYPLMVRVAGREEERRSDLIFTAVAFTAASSLTFSAIVAASLCAFGHPDIASAAALYFVLWQLQDVLRRSLLAEFRYQAAALGDGVTYMGAAAVVALVASYGSLSLVTALVVMTGMCGLAIVIQIIQRLPISWGMTEPRPLLRNFWTHGKWAFANGLILVVTMQMFPWSLALLQGKIAVAEFQAALNIANVVNPIAFGLSSLILPAVAQAHEHHNIEAAWKAGRKYIVIGATLISLYAVPVMFMPNAALLLFYGPDSPYVNLHLTAAVMVLAVAMNSIADMTSVFFYGIKAAKRLVWMNSVSLGVALLILPLAGAGGVLSCALALAAAKCIRLIALWRLVTQMLSPGLRFFWLRLEWAERGRVP
jgi:O-antigen/teichoic acid export membrane protein